MKLLIDANLSPVVAALLRDSGFDASHVRDHGLTHALDPDIAQFAVDHGFTVVSSDSDFAMLLALSGSSAPSLVLLRSKDTLTPTEQASMLIANLNAVSADLDSGSVVSIRPGQLRVRSLPL